MLHNYHPHYFAKLS